MVKAKVDSYEVRRYEETRFVDTVELLEEYRGHLRKKLILCYSPKYRANVLIPKKELFILT